jgi:hypothetical protein
LEILPPHFADGAADASIADYRLGAQPRSERGQERRLIPRQERIARALDYGHLLVCHGEWRIVGHG